MAAAKPLLTWSWPAGEDLHERQFRAVKVVEGRLVLAGPDEHAWGILLNQPHAGSAGLVMIHGVTKAVVNGGGGNAVAPGDPLKVGPEGALVKATENGDKVVGRCLEAVASDGVVASVLLTPFEILVVSGL